MIRRDFSKSLAALAAAAVLPQVPQIAQAHDVGVIRTRSGYGMQETIDRVVRDLADKKIKLFTIIDQAALAKEAGVDLNPSSLIIFGNPPLGTQFLTANPQSGLDWPVRLLVYQDDKGHVWTAYSDFNWIAARYNIRSRKAQFAMATKVIKSIVSSTVATATQ